MPLTVQQLNADTTFLLTFSIPKSLSSPNDSRSSDFTILIDPWLNGPSPIFHSSFAVSSHTTESAIQSLSELRKPPDLIIVSQPKNDHCNKGTLSSLPVAWSGIIAAVPAAAKKIRSWKLFAENQVKVIPAYNARNFDTCVQILLGKDGRSGNVVLANIPEPYDLSAVHNAIGITLTAPSDLPQKPLSILYTPHGLTTSLLEPYLTHHLQSIGAHPIDLLFHSLNIEANPRLMGGIVSNGAPGGVEIAKLMGAKTWMGAHDEEKENGGIATRLIKCTRFTVEEVEERLEREGVMGTKVRCLGVGETLELG